MEEGLNKRELQAKQTHEKLVATSKKLIIERGYNQVSVNDICKACKIAKGTFYIYFNTKRDIINEIMADINIQMFTREWLKTGTARERLEEYIDVYFQVIEAQGADFTREALKVMMDLDVDIDRVHAEKHVEHIEGILRFGIANGEIDSKLDVVFSRRMLQNLIFGMMLEWCSKGDASLIFDYGKNALTCWLNQIFSKAECFKIKR